MHAKKEYQELDLKPYGPFGLGISLLEFLAGLTLISLALTAIYEFFF